jgi:arsenate reductase
MRLRNLILLLPVFGACATATAGDGPRTPAKTSILFLCPYGGAKSVIAASYFNRLAEQQALPYVAVAAAAEEPYAAVPAPVAELLQREGFDVRTFKPRHVASEDVNGAAKVVSIDCNLDAVDLGGAIVERWDDVPKVSDGVDASAAAIRRNVETLVEVLAKELRDRR